MESSFEKELIKFLSFNSCREKYSVNPDLFLQSSPVTNKSEIQNIN